MKVLMIFGTRPEAVKLAPLIGAIRSAGLELVVCVTGQHREMLDQVLRVFEIVPDIDLNLMKSGQSLSELTAELILKIRDVLQSVRPDRVIVQGDTTTAFAGALAAYYAKVPVGHVEAGLRTGELMSPWPEEGNRKLIGAIADLHFAPTKDAQDNLLREGVSRSKVFVTGNTVIDALLDAMARLNGQPELNEKLRTKFDFLNSDSKMILVTGHRRESFGDGFERICLALSDLARREDVQIVYPVHLNPKVREPVYKILQHNDRVFLIEPLEYLPFLYLMNRSYLILTDSGGVQEEAPSLGKPVLVMRDQTEREEAIRSGTAELVGTTREGICAAANRLLDDHREYHRRSQISNPFGDGAASARIAALLKEHQAKGHL